MSISKSPLLGMAFRPFFLLGTLAGVVSLIVWLLAYTGSPGAIVVDSLWHAHEMIFGFVTAIVVGFLLTASQNWSGLRGVHGRKLFILTAVWVLARLLAYAPAPFSVLGSGLDLAFLPLVVGMLWPYLAIPAQKRNRAFLIILGLLWTCNLVFHAGAAALVSDFRRQALLVAVQIVVLIVVIIAGRVIPFFSKNAVEGYKQKSSRSVDLLAVGFSLLFVVAVARSEFGRITFLTGLAAGTAHLVRLSLWFEPKVLTRPILTVLYAGYLWIPVGYVFAALAANGLILTSLATHAFTVGGISVMIIGMMSRVTRGHTGRPIVASKWAAASFLCVSGAGVVRVFLPVLFPGLYVQSVILSAALWIVAAVVFVFEHAPMLVSPRTDGREG